MWSAAWSGIAKSSNKQSRLEAGNGFISGRRKKAPSAALEGQADNSPGPARHERRPGGNAHTNQSPFFLFCPENFEAKQEKGRCSFLVGLPRAALRLPGAAIISSLQDFGFGSLRSQMPNDEEEP